MAARQRERPVRRAGCAGQASHAKAASGRHSRPHIAYANTRSAPGTISTLSGALPLSSPSRSSGSGPSYSIENERTWWYPMHGSDTCEPSNCKGRSESVAAGGRKTERPIPTLPST